MRARAQRKSGHDANRPARSDASPVRVPIPARAASEVSHAPGVQAPTGPQPRSEHAGHFAHVPVSPRIQRKPAVGAPADAAEREADAAAQRVAGGSTALHAASQRARTARLDTDTATRAAGRGGGPLPGAERAYFEPRFGYDFSHVRVHADEGAAEGARAVRARAFTLGRDIVFGAGEFSPGTREGRTLIAHELAHVVQQDAGAAGGMIRRVPDPKDEARFQKALQDKNWTEAAWVLHTAFSEADIKKAFTGLPRGSVASIHYAALNDARMGAASKVADLSRATYLDINYENELKKPNWPKAAEYLNGFSYADIVVRVARLDATAQASLRAGAVSISADPVVKAIDAIPQIASLKTQKASLEAVTAKGSGKSLGEVGSAYAKLKDVSHDLAVLETGKGIYEGNRCTVKTPGAIATDCTNIVMEVLGDTFAQQGKGAEWTRVQKKLRENTTARGGVKMSGVDLQAALQSELAWKAIYWAPDPSYVIPDAEISGVKGNEASYTRAIVKKQGTYYKDFGKKGYPGLSIGQSVTNYAPEAPTSGTASTTTRDTSMLAKLKKLPFGVLSAHGGFHMTIITYGKVIEVHWRAEANSVDVIEQTDLEKWAVGPSSGYHYYASGAIVAPAADVDAAFK